jgi:subtilisin family serine protease
MFRFIRFFLCGSMAILSFVAWAQQAPFKASEESAIGDVAFDVTEIPDAPTPQNTTNANPSKKAAGEGSQNSQEQPKRILGLMPNYRAVTAGEIPPPPTPKEAFKIATLNSFDYSSYLFVGITSLLAEGSAAHPDLGKGPAGYWRYYWRGFVDKTDGNYLVIFALPTVFHQDERYYAKGEGNIWKRVLYASSRVLITPDYHGHNTFNTSEILGRGIAQGISMSYYPSNDRKIGEISEKYGFAVGRDALTDIFREFWPDISNHIHHRHP